jgi:hypothetical protein
MIKIDTKGDKMKCEQCEYIYDCPMYEEALDKDMPVVECPDFEPSLDNPESTFIEADDTTFKNVEQIIGG